MRMPIARVQPLKSTMERRGKSSTEGRILGSFVSEEVLLSYHRCTSLEVLNSIEITADKVSSP